MRDEVRDGVKGMGVVLVFAAALVAGVLIGLWRLLVALGRKDWTKGSGAK